MSVFSFRAKDELGTLQQGTIDAASPAAVVSELRSRNWMVIDVQHQIDDVKPESNTRWYDRLPFFRARQVHVELSLRQIVTMLRSGLTLLTTLTNAVEHSPRAALGRIWLDVIDRIQGGSNLADAMSQHDCFPSYVIRLVRVGEQTGDLDAVIEQGAQMMQKRRETLREMMTATAYPAIVIALALGVSTYMVVYLIPKLGQLLTSLGKELPAMTQWLLDIGTWFQLYGSTLLASSLIFLAAFGFYYLTPSGRYVIDRLALRLPIFGKLFRILGTITFSRTLSIMLKSGISMIDGLSTVESMHYNRFLAQRVAESRQAVILGSDLASSLKRPGGYTPLLPKTIAVGEQAGSLEDVLNEMTVYHQSMLQSFMKQLAAWATPVITILIGSIVGFVYIAFFLALFAVAGK